ncbi:hypothetical protein MAR_014159 [Mya arenaria]|uniref:Uncharacterized protein n=1 Tax=Mya arenaria TaxID=6604 RepID=A0ABY7G4I8_MYAAR|nr:hypothetical protein MAR_014143 [Mya arenaria]WAR28455.1 hypothetical protein MAR_014159 [Mya arenaria]
MDYVNAWLRDRAACSDDGDAYYLYCSTDHDCCSIDGRTTLSKYEVAGIVISCVAVTFAALLTGPHSQCRATQYYVITKDIQLSKRWNM